MSFQWIVRSSATLFFLFFAVSVQAQFEMPQAPGDVPEISDQELQAFVDASLIAQQIQTESQMEMIAVVEEEGLELEKYNEIIQGMQMGQGADDMNVSSSDMRKFEKASEQIGEIEEQMETRLVAAIEDRGMELDRYQQVFAAIQTSPELQQKIRQLLQEAQMRQNESIQQEEGQ